jgi:hypothetical protein
MVENEEEIDRLMHDCTVWFNRFLAELLSRNEIPMNDILDRMVKRGCITGRDRDLIKSMIEREAIIRDPLSIEYELIDRISTNITRKIYELYREKK